MKKTQKKRLPWLQTKQSTNSQLSFDPFRAKLLLFLLSFAFIVFMARAVYLQLLPDDSTQLSGLANRQYERTLTLAKYRGSILDRRGEPLAISVKRPSFYINPKTFTISLQKRKLLAQALEMDYADLSRLLKKDSHFRWLVRRSNPKQRTAIENLKLSEIRQTFEPARFYPSGEITSSLLGIVGSDDQGLTGIEHTYNDVVSGQASKVIEARDARGNTILFDANHSLPEEPGFNLVLTIDRALQEIAYEKLEAGVLAAKAKSGLALVMDPHSGAILASVNYPSFDPNAPKLLSIDRTRHLPLMNTFEPGSVLKPIHLSLGFKTGQLSLQTKEDCENGKYRIGRHVIHDSHVLKEDILGIQDIVTHSSNVCTLKLVEKLGKNAVFTNLQDFGFSESSSDIFSFTGLARGRLTEPKKWSDVQFANIAFGQGLTTTALEIASAYSVFANGGRLMVPRMVSRVESADGQVIEEFLPKIKREVLSASIAGEWMNILRTVVDKGAVLAQSPKYTTAGKTGTTQKVDSMTGRYSHSLHLASFIGIAPALDPHLVIYVQIDEPQIEPHYGAIWAAPVFRDLAEESLSYLNVAPDKKPSLAIRENPEINKIVPKD